MVKNSIFSILILISTLFVSGCKNSSQNEKLTIAVSIVPQKAFVDAVVGNLADVVVLVPPGSSPANYQPTPMIMEEFNNADIYFSIGVPTERSNIIPKISHNKDLKIIELHKSVAQIYPDREFAPGKRDGHIWLSPKRVKVMVRVIADELSIIDPDNRDQYQKNALFFITQLDDLDSLLQNTTKDLNNRSFIVFHPAFGYLADDYNLKMYALEHNGKEATAQRLKNMIDLAKEKEINVIFHQSEISSEQSLAFAREIGGTAVKLEPLSYDYIDNLKLMTNTISKYMK
jgi:zinc transport system substrate-binding protein